MTILALSFQQHQMPAIAEHSSGVLLGSLRSKCRFFRMLEASWFSVGVRARIGTSLDGDTCEDSDSDSGSCSNSEEFIANKRGIE